MDVAKLLRSDRKQTRRTDDAAAAIITEHTVRREGLAQFHRRDADRLFVADIARCLRERARFVG